MDKKTLPYIGITGFMHSSEIGKLICSLPHDLDYKLMVGVLASYRTLENMSEKYPKRYPDVLDIDDIFWHHNRTLNLIHYSTNLQDKTADALSVELTKVMYWGGRDCHGLQLNLTWPDVRALEEYKKLFDENYLVLQIGKRAFERIGNNPLNLVAKLKDYQGLVDYVSLDMSGGQGLNLNCLMMRDYLMCLYDNDLPFNYCVAGGLSAKSLDSFAGLFEEFNELSIDAESNLRDQEDKLDILIAQEYLCKASTLLVASALV
jgi:hypothetical protein